MSNPWMKFYPSDWRGSRSLKLVSMAARGLWIEMLCIMHEAHPYGHLVHEGRALTPLQLANMVGAQVSDVEIWLAELGDAGVLRRKKSGVIFSIKMEKDENRRRIGRETGKRGGNPSLSKTKEKPETLNGTVNGGGYVRGRVRSQKPEARGSDLIERSAPDPDLDRRAWSEGVRLLMGQSGVTEKAARAFFGKLLSDNKLSARQLLPALASVELAGTPEPQAYLSKSAKACGSAFQSPVERARLGHEAYVRSNII